MVQGITPQQFHQAIGVQDWRVDERGANACFLTDTFERGVDFVNAIARHAHSQNHHPDVDLRYSSVTVRLFTHEANAVSERDVDLARVISSTARSLGIVADPSRVKGV